MKKAIHPNYNDNLKVTCSCGNSFVTGSTLEQDSIAIEICSNCHPFYTGEQKIVDTDNLVKKYEERVEKSKKMSFKSKKEKMAKRKEKAKEDAKRSSSTLTLKDMLDNAKVSK
jgi:large subunit ribosomal protein L31